MHTVVFFMTSTVALLQSAKYFSYEYVHATNKQYIKQRQLRYLLLM